MSVEDKVVSSGAQVDAAAIREQWDKLAQESPRLRAIDIADRIGVSEAQLIASRVGQWAQRLAPDRFADILRGLPAVGEVMALTRNEHVVHEKVGSYGHVTIQPGHAIVLNHHIDLRLFMGQWHHGFALTQPLADGGVRQSLQFFDASGRAVHKVFARGETDMAAWSALVSRCVATEQSDTLGVKPLPALPADLPDEQIDQAGMHAHWSAMRDTHDFFGMLRDFRVGRHQAMRLIGSEYAMPVANDAVRIMLEQAAASGLSIMCFVGNPGCIQIHTGPVANIKMMGDWLNVMDPKFNLHLRTDRIATSWLVRKPTDDGVVTSLELFDEQQRQFVQFFGERKPGQKENAQWRELAESLVDHAGAVQ